MNKPSYTLEMLISNFLLEPIKILAESRPITSFTDLISRIGGGWCAGQVLPDVQEKMKIGRFNPNAETLSERYGVGDQYMGLEGHEHEFDHVEWLASKNPEWFSGFITSERKLTDEEKRDLLNTLVVAADSEGVGVVRLNFLWLRLAIALGYSKPTHDYMAWAYTEDILLMTVSSSLSRAIQAEKSSTEVAN